MNRTRVRPGRLVAMALLVLVTIGQGSATPLSSLEMSTQGETTPSDIRAAPTPSDDVGAVTGPESGTSSGAGRNKTGRPRRGAAESDQVLSISSVTPWVEADGEFQVRFSPTSIVPPDAKLTYTIHQSLVSSEKQSLRSKVLDMINGGPTGKVLQAPVTRTLAEYGDPTAGAVVSIPVRSSTSSDSKRAFLPNSGIHPVDLVLTTADGPELWSQVVFLNRLPRKQKAASKDEVEESTRPVTVSMILPIQTGPAFSTDMSPNFPLESRFLLDSTTGLLTAAQSAPLRLGLRPDTFAGLTRVNETWAQNLVTAIGNATGADPNREGGKGTGSGEGDGAPVTTPPTTTPAGPPGGASILRLPFAGLDVGALANPNAGFRTSAGPTLEHQLSLGAKVLAEVANEAPTSSTWVFDETVTNEALPLIKSMNFTGVALPASRIETNEDLDSEQLMTGPVKLDGPSQLRAIAYDDAISQQLSNPSIDPAVRAHEALAILMSSWFSANQTRSELSVPTSVIVIPPTTDPEVVTTLASALSGDGPLRISTGASLIPPATRGIEEPTTRLAFRPPADISGTVAESLDTQRQINAVNSLSGSAEPALDMWEFLNAETFAVGMGVEQRKARHDTIRAQVALILGAIETPPPRRVVLATRQTTIPLRFRNGLPYEIRLRMQARSPRLDVRFTDADLVVLEPGENRVDLPVEVRAPGESLLRVQLTTPDDAIVLSSFDIPVRSTSISGVGSALSIISIVFLLIWWLRTMRKRRREAGRASSLHPSAAGAPPGADTVEESG